VDLRSNAELAAARGAAERGQALNGEQAIMSDDHDERRREDRIPVEADASVESSDKGRTAHAKSINMSSAGVLLRFDEPVPLAVGDRVTCDFLMHHEPSLPLPYWGLGRIVRVGAGGTVAVELQSVGLRGLGTEDSTSPTLPFDAS
jgi:hypothetical protein